MKRLNMIIPALGLFATVAMGGGIVTNTNHSAEFVRTLNRNASTSVDAAYYNPAGIARLGEGLHIGLSNQSIFQTKDVSSDLVTLNTDAYSGEVKAVFFPDLHVAYKMGQLAFSGSVMPIGGGGSADYASGLPMFEYDLAGLVGVPAAALNPALAALGTISGYTADAAFKGSSVYLGAQAGVAYAINNMISVSVGGRYVMADNVYEGSLAGLTLPTSSGVPITSAHTTMLADKEVDVTQSGTGFNVIVGADVAPMPGLNIGLRYEMITKLELTTDITKDEAGLFGTDPVQADMPAILALGVSYAILPELSAQASFNYYMNTSVNWDGAEEFLDNGFDGGLGIEYALSEALTAGAGFMYTKSGVTEDYRDNLHFNLDATTLGLGVGYQVTPSIQLNVGALTTFYSEATKADASPLPLSNTMKANETYNQTNIDFVIGINYSL